MNFNGPPKDRREILRNVPVKVGWSLPYIELEAQGACRDFDLVASDGIYLSSVDLKPSERPRKITYKCSCIDAHLAQWNKWEALKFTDRGYMAQEILASKNSYFVKGYILEGDIQIFANPEQTKVHIGKNAKEEDLEFLKRLRLVPEDFELGGKNLIKVDGKWFGKSEISEEWQRLNK